MSEKVFISHCVKDKKFVDKFNDYLRLATDLQVSNIFCSSFEETGIKTGKTFVQYIRDSLLDSKIVIAIITNNYCNSQFCLSELGAAWGVGIPVFPVIITPLNYSDLEGVLYGTQGIKIDDEKKLQNIMQEIAEEIGNPIKVANITRKTDNFLEELPNYLKLIPDEKKYDQKYVETIQNELKSYKIEYDEISDKNELLEAQIEELKKCKNKDDVNEVLLESLNTEEKLEVIVDNCKEKLLSFSSIIQYLIFKYIKTSDAFVTFKDLQYRDDIVRELKDAEDNDYVYSDEDNNYFLNTKDRKIKNCIDKIELHKEELASFNDAEIEALEDKYDVTMNFSNKKFWETILKVNLPCFGV